MRIFAIDPGPAESAWVRLDTADGIGAFAKEPNSEVRYRIDEWGVDVLAVEMIASYGMPVGAEVFQTCVEIGRFVETWDRLSAEPPLLIPRIKVKSHMCHSAKATDTNVRQALIDLYGPGKEKAIGMKKSPGPLYGVTGDVWAALGVAVTAASILDGDRIAA